MGELLEKAKRGEYNDKVTGHIAHLAEMYYYVVEEAMKCDEKGKKTDGQMSSLSCTVSEFGEGFVSIRYQKDPFGLGERRRVDLEVIANRNPEREIRVIVYYKNLAFLVEKEKGGGYMLHLDTRIPQT